jgi:hypothetical protein
VLFNLACVHRVRDLLGPQCLRCVDAASGWTKHLRLHQMTPYSARLGTVRDEVGALWRQRADPLHEAKIAAARAVISLGLMTLATSEMVCVASGRRVGQPGLPDAVRAERRVHATLMRCVFVIPLRPSPVPTHGGPIPSWLSRPICANHRTTPRCRSWPMRCKTPDAIMRTF